MSHDTRATTFSSPLPGFHGGCAGLKLKDDLELLILPSAGIVVSWSRITTAVFYGAVNGTRGLVQVRQALHQPSCARFQREQNKTTPKQKNTKEQQPESKKTPQVLQHEVLSNTAFSR